MKTKSNDQGRAYEYVWIETLYRNLSSKRQTKIIKNSSYYANKKAWENIDTALKNLFQISADAAVNTILELEPLILEDSEDELLLKFQNDSSGIAGDVRDIVISRNNIQWEFGLSIKHNHEAIKHSRLSYKLDFGEEWFGSPCSSSYWDTVNPIFNKLMAEKNKKTKWSDIPDKEKNVYIPLLNAFINEVKTACAADKTIPQKMVEYLIGTKDYYKIISHDKKRITLIRTFNVHNTLNKKGKTRISSVTVPIVELPTELIALKLKSNSGNTAEMYLNNGWQISFRIHNASTIVEPSLKFDIQFIGMPVSVYNIECKWS